MCRIKRDIFFKYYVPEQARLECKVFYFNERTRLIYSNYGILFNYIKLVQRLKGPADERDMP